MPPQSLDGVWRLTAALLGACDVATDPERHASSLWLSAVADVTDNLLTELDSTGREVEVVADTEKAAVSPVSPSRPQTHGHALDDAAAKLEELAIQKRRTGPSSSAAEVESLMVRTVKILVRCMELKLFCREDSPSGDLKAKMCAAVLRVVGRCTITVEFRRSIQALQNCTFEIKLGSSADATFHVKLDAIWPVPSDLQRRCFSLRMSTGMLRCFRLTAAILTDEKRALQVQPSHGRWSRRKGITRNDLSKLLQQCVSKELRHECAEQGLPALKNLEIIRCNELVSLVGLSTLSSIERLKIVKCPKLDVVNNWQRYHFKKITTSRYATVIST